jgi:hypothetical protein
VEVSKLVVTPIAVEVDVTVVRVVWVEVAAVGKYVLVIVVRVVVRVWIVVV